MMNRLVLLCTIALLLGGSLANAQSNTSYLWQNPSFESNFYDIQNDFNKYWEGKTITPETPRQERMGWKQFKRWEWFWEQRVTPSGVFPSPRHTFEEYLKVRAKRSKNNNSTQVSTLWSHLGPNTAPGGYEGMGRINCVKEDPNYNGTSNRILWAGAASGGIWKSTDAGASWTTNTDELAVLGIADIVIDHSNTNIMYAATGDGDASDTYSVGVLKSTDAGQTWNYTGYQKQVTDYSVCRRMIMSHTNTSLLIVATNSGLYRTTDAGTTWTQVKTGNFYDVKMHPTNSNIVYSATNNVFYRSTDAGANWTQVTSVLPSSTSQRYALAVTPAQPDYVFVLSSNGSGAYVGVYRSTDSGQNFTTQSTTPNMLNSTSNGSGTSGQGWYDLAFAVDPLDANNVFVGGVNIWKSTNGGTTWAIKTYWTYLNGVQEVHADHHMMLFGGTNRLYTGNDGGVDRSTDGGTTWTYLGSGLKITQFYRISTAQTNADFVLCGAQDNSSFLRNTTSFGMTRATGDGMDQAINPSNASIMFTSSYYGNMSRSLNGGVSWSGISKPSDDGGWVTPYRIDPNNNTTLIAGFKQVWKSTDNGSSWTSISNFSNTNTLTCLYIAPSNSNYIYVGRSGAMWRTTNGGTTWSSVTLPSSSLTSIATSHTNPDLVWITMSGYSSGTKVFKSTNGGSTWTNISGTLPNVPCNVVTYQAYSNNRVFVGTDIGVWYRSDTDSDWIEYNNGLPNVVCNDIEIYYAGAKLRVGTYGRGLWEVDLPDAPNMPPTLVSPANYSTSVPLNTSLTWNNYSGSTGFRVQFSTSSSFATTLLDTVISGTSKSLSGLTDETLYYWRVKAYISNDSTDWSSTWRFTTNNIISIGNGASASEFPYYTWYMDANTTLLYTASELIAAGLSAGSINKIGFDVSAYSSQTMQQLEVKMQNTALSSINTYVNTGWSVARSAADYAVPGAGVNLLTLNNPFYWDGVSNLLINICFNNSTYTGSSFVAADSLPDKVYALFNDLLNESGCTEISSLTSSTQPYRAKLLIKPMFTMVAPTLQSPSNNASGITVAPNLIWNSSTNATSYRVQVSTSNTFATLIKNETSATTIKAISGLLNSTLYYWRVKAYSASDSSDWSPVWSFTTIGLPPAVPVLQSPANLATNLNINQLLAWNTSTNAIRYRIQVASNNLFNVLVINDTTSALSKALNGLSYYTNYYWRVKAYSSTDSSDWSSVWSFQTKDTVPEVPTLEIPFNFASNVAQNTSLNWVNSNYAKSFRVQLSTSNSFNTLIVDDSLTQTTKQISNLALNTDYFWRVKAYSTVDSSNWSDVKTFTTIKNIDYLPVGTGSFTGAFPFHTLNMNANTTLLYTASELTAAGFTAGHITKIGFDILSASILPINNFHIQMQNSSLSSISSFIFSGWTTVRNSSLYVIPSTGHRLIDLNTPFYWDGTSNLLVNICFDNNAWLNNSIVLADFQPGKAFALFNNIQSNSGCEDIDSLLQFANALRPNLLLKVNQFVDPPALATPTNNSINVTLNPTLTWNSATNATSYKLQVSTNILFTNIIHNQSLNTTNQSIAGLSHNTTYYWRVRSYSSTDSSDWSSVWNFTTVAAAPAIPTLATPANNATGVAVAPTLTWNASSNATSYRVQVSTSNTFATLTKNETSVSTSKAISGLLNNTLYYWRAKAYSASDSSDWSSVWNFTTVALAPAIPTLATPANNATGVAVAPTLSWNASSNATSYRVQVSTSNTFATLTKNETSVATSKAISGLLNNTLYYWRAKAYSASDSSDWSSVWSFTTLPLSNLPSSWDFTANTGNFATIGLQPSGSYKIGNRSLSNGDAIGVFYDRSGADVCAGYLIWDGVQFGVIAWGDDDQTTLKDGFAVNENYKFKIWDSQTSTTYNANVRIIQGDGFYTLNGITVIDSASAITSVTQNIPLASGWNMISGNVAPQVTTISSIVSPLSPNMTMIKNAYGQTYWLPFFTSLSQWNIKHAYQVRMTAADTLPLTGSRIVPETNPIPLTNGWYWLPYYRTSNMAPASALTTLQGHYSQVKSLSGQVYWPPFFNTLTNLEPNKGYLIYITAADTLTYPANSPKTSAGDAIIVPKPKVFVRDEIVTGSTAVLALEADGIEDGDEIAVFTLDGKLVGSAVWGEGSRGVVIWGDDEFTTEKEGASEGEELVMKIWKRANKSISDIRTLAVDEITSQAKSSSLRYSTNAMYKLSGELSEVAEAEIFITPQPASDEVYIRLVSTSERVGISLFNQAGETALKGSFELTNGLLRLDTKDLPSGVYQLLIQDGQKMRYAKVVILK